MIIYKAEADAGLTDAIAKASVCYASEVTLSDRFPTDHVKLAAASQNDNDLHYLKTLLVTTGWNKNEDVFDRAEVWNARSTPEDKPFNLEHNSADIIGHIIGNYVVDDSGKTLADDTLVDNLPDKFHVITPSVLYKYWDRKELQERMDKIIAEIKEGKWYVSMEALFKNFDYAVLKDGVQKIVARNEQTAFLTKHLRAYGGDGTYDNGRVGRLLRNPVFSGKGLVRKPANPESIIFTSANFPVYLTREVQMDDKKYAELVIENEKLKKTLAESDAKKLQDELNAIKAERDSYKKAHEEHKLHVDDLNKKMLAAQEAHSKMSAHVEDLKKAHNDEMDAAKKHLEEAKAELNQIKASQVKAERIAKVVAAFKATEEKSVEHAKSFAENLLDLSDEKFEAVVKAIEATPNLHVAPGNTEFPHGTPKEAPKATSAPVGPKATDKPAPMAGPMVSSAADSETDAAAAGADPALLDTAKPVTQAALSTAVDNKTEELQKAISEFFAK